MKDGVKVILEPSRHRAAVKYNKRKGANFLTMAKFVEEIQEETYDYALVVEEQNVGRLIPQQLEHLIEEFFFLSYT